MERHRKHYNFSCSICAHEFIEKSSKDLHEAGHANGGEGLLVCEVCDMTFKDEEGLFGHLDAAHDMRPLHGNYNLRKNNGERPEQNAIKAYFDEAGIQYREEHTLHLPAAGRGRRVFFVDFLIQ
jgi:uncharacterized C2H2 Zn-finger protein